MTTVRVRFAPSPTGFLHVGNVRAGLYNWLWARQHVGQFILRVEDTDRERSTKPAVQSIIDSLRWLGLDWDEGPEVGGQSGPYFQMERLSIYRDFADQLIAMGRAYRCYCTAPELEAARAMHKQNTGSEQGFRYPGTCRDRKDEPDRPHVVRFRAPTTGVTGWDDLVKGRIEVPNNSLQDAVLIRNNGVPLYNLGAAVDDITMGITLVARGDDHVVNTPQQILIYEALDAALPQFAHTPMLLGAGGEKMSKRDGAVGVLDYREQGYLPDAMLNYLARLGWSHGDQEIFSRAELIEKFDWRHVGHTGSRWDAKKLQHVQATHLRKLPGAKVGALCSPFLAARGLTVDAHDPRLPVATELVLSRASTLVEVAEAVDYFFRDEPVMDNAAAAKLLTPESGARLTALAAQLGAVEPFDRETLEIHIKRWLEAEGLSLQDVAQAARVALTGRKASPGLFEVLEVLGKARSVARLQVGAARAQQQKPQ
jgi:glutamyl-tRNA synthetase